MCVDKQIDDLIESGWEIVDEDCDPDDFHDWKTQTLESPGTLLSSDHTHSRCFRARVCQEAPASLLVGAGTLFAVIEAIQSTGSLDRIFHCTTRGGDKDRSPPP